MNGEPPDHNRLFVDGYDRGRMDGIAQAITVMGVIAEVWPVFVPKNVLAVLPEAHAIQLSSMLHAFGDRCKAYGIRENKQRQAAKAKGAA